MKYFEYILIIFYLLTLIMGQEEFFSISFGKNDKKNKKKTKKTKKTMSYVFLNNNNNNNPTKYVVEVVFAGDAAVGKTSFINRITKGVFLSNLSSTLGKVLLPCIYILFDHQISQCLKT